MPRSKPTQVTEHRVTVGTWEREQLKALTQAKIVKDVGTGVGVAAVGIGGTYCAYKIGKAIYDWGEDIMDSEIGKTVGGIFKTPDSMVENLRTGGQSDIKSSGLLYILSGGLFGEPAGE